MGRVAEVLRFYSALQDTVDAEPEVVMLLKTLGRDHGLVRLNAGGDGVVEVAPSCFAVLTTGTESLPLRTEFAIRLHGKLLGWGISTAGNAQSGDGDDQQPAGGGDRGNPLTRGQRAYQPENGPPPPDPRNSR